MLLTVLFWLIAAIAVPAGIYAWQHMYRELSHPARWWAWFLASPMLMAIIFFSVISVTDFGWWTTLSRTMPLLLTIVALATPLYVWRSMRWWVGFEYMYKDFLTEEGRKITEHRRRIEREVREFRKTDQFPPRKSDDEDISSPSPDVHARDR